MGVFDRQIANAKRSIAHKGQSVIWREPALADADSDTPWKPGDAPPDDHVVNIVFLPDNRTNYEFLALMANTEVPKGRLIGLMAAVDFTPTLKGVVIRDGVTLGVRTIDPLAPNGQAILYTIGFDG